MNDVWFETPSSEVHFKARHLSNFPWGEEAKWPQPNLQLQEVPVVELCHDTHKAQFDQIKQPNSDCMIVPQKKNGKKGYVDKETKKRVKTSYTPEDTGDDLTGSTRYCIIHDNEEVLPGYYSWWSIHKTDSPPPPPAADDSDDLLKNPPSSVYGSRRISVTFHDLLYSYQDGFSEDGQYKHLQFRNGGTLRYKREICYVVIVCAEGQFTGADGDYPVMGAFEIEYEANERIRTVEEWRVRIHTTDVSPYGCCWDHFVFAFYYPDNKGRLHLPGQVTKHEKINHTSFCQKREERYNPYRWECPDVELNQ